MSIQLEPPLLLISMTPPSKKVLPANSNEYRCVKVKLKLPTEATFRIGDIRNWSAAALGSGPSQRWSEGVTSRRRQGSEVSRAGLPPGVHCGLPLSTSSDADWLGTSS